MLNLPNVTQVQKPIPKAQIYRKFQLTSAQQKRFDADISRIDIVNELSPKTIPAIKEGEKVKSIFVFSVTMKTKEYDKSNIEKIAKLIPQHLVFVLQYEEEVQLAVYFEDYFSSPWMPEKKAKLDLSGFNFDDVWENFIKTIAGGTWNSDLTLKENIEVKQKKDKLRREIERLEAQARKESQPKAKYELVQKKRELEKELKEQLLELGNESR